MLSPALLRNSRGFTLIELMVVLVILGIISVTTMPIFAQYTSSQRLSQAAKNFKNDIRAVQNRAISGIEGRVWGIDLSDPAGTAYTVYSCPTTASPYRPTGPGCTTYQAKTLPSPIIYLPGASYLAYDSTNGDLYADSSLWSGSVQINVRLSGSPDWVIRVYQGGKIEDFKP